MDVYNKAAVRIRVCMFAAVRTGTKIRCEAAETLGKKNTKER